MKIQILACVLLLAGCAQPYEPETLEIVKKGGGNLYQVNQAVKADKLVGASLISSGYGPCMGTEIRNQLEGAVPDQRDVDAAISRAESQCASLWPVFIADLRKNAPSKGFDPNFSEAEIRTATRQATARVIAKSYGIVPS